MRVQEALGQLVGAAKEGLLALSVEVGLGVLRELLEQEVDEIVGPKGRWNPDRTAVRHGHENGEVILGGRRAPVSRPRVRTADGESEVALQTCEHFADRDQLRGVVLERMLAGVSTRQYRRAQEPVGEQVETDARSTSKSAVSRTFVQRTRDQLWNLMNKPPCCCSGACNVRMLASAVTVALGRVAVRGRRARCPRDAGRGHGGV